MAKVNLKPSALALRKGETVENTKGTRTRYAVHSHFIFILPTILDLSLLGPFICKILQIVGFQDKRLYIIEDINQTVLAFGHNMVKSFTF